jgi:hypothetical protein
MIATFFQSNRLFFLWSALFGLPLVLAQVFLLSDGSNQVIHFILLSWGFLFLITVLLLGIIEILMKKRAGILGFAFLASILVKLVVSILYLYPEIQLSKETGSKLILHFFIPYFVFLTIETVQVYKRLNKAENELPK